VESQNTVRRAPTIWLTGLSGAGKTTLAHLVAQELRDRQMLVEILDGDIIRENLSKGLGFSQQDRETNIRRIGFVSNLLSRNGVCVIVAAISPYRLVRDEIRAAHNGAFFEVHVDCPIDVLVTRDPKGLYKKALAGEIQNFTGISDPYEPPTNPKVVARTSIQSPADCVQSILEKLETKQLVLPRKCPA
jgi:adenylylsulfate kinase